MKLAAVSNTELARKLADRSWRYVVPLGIVAAFVCVSGPIAHSDDRPAKQSPFEESDEAIEEIPEETPKPHKKVEPIKYGGPPEKQNRREQRKRRTIEEEESTPSPPTLPEPANSDGDLFGVLGQGGHLAFKTFGRSDSITPIEAMPFYLMDQHFFFADVRGFVSNNSTGGANIGLGYRNLRDELNSWFGGSLWLDVDGTSGKTYQQIGLSLEAMMQRWEMRSNIYVPVSSSKTISSTAINSQIVGNQLLYSQYLSQAKPLTGVDFEVGYNIPVMEPHRLRAFVGGYHFDGGSKGSVNGFKTRMEGVINNMVTAQVMYTNDPLFGSNIMVGCELQFWWGTSHPSNTWAKESPSPFRFVERNYNVIVDRVNTTSTGHVAYNPLTNSPYLIEQVASGAGPGGTGTTANPYSTVSAAQSAGNVILVQGNSIFNTPVTLTSGQYLLGDGSSQQLPLVGGGSVALPRVIAGSQAPQFTNITGDGVTLASNSVVSGFNFSNVTGNAIAGSGINSGTISNNMFQNIGMDAMHLANSGGSFFISGNTVKSATGDGLNFTGGSANLTFTGSVSGTKGDGIALSNLTGGNVNINNATVSSTSGAGLLLNSVATDVNVTSLSTSQTGGPAVSIMGGTSADTYHLAGITNIQQPNGIGLNLSISAARLVVDNLTLNSTANSPAVSLTNSTGLVQFSNLGINTTNATGLQANDLTSLIVSKGSITTANASAIDIQSSTISVNLSQVSVDTAPIGVRLLQDTGPFVISGNGAYASGGTIQNATTGLILNTNGAVSVAWLDLTKNGTGIQSTGTTQLNLTDLRVTNSTGYALDSLDDVAVTLANSQFSGNGAVGGGTIRSQVDKVASYSWLIQGNTITDPNGTAILLATKSLGSGATLTGTVMKNTLTGSGAGSSLVNVNWNGPLTALVSTNTLTAQGANMTGTTVQDASTTNTSNTESVHVTTNTMSFTGTQGTGSMVALAGENTTQVDTNKINFGGVSGIGLRFNMTGTGTNYIVSNTITDNAGGATGMLFDNVAPLTTVQIDSNSVALLANDPMVHRGIIFSNAQPTITLLSKFNNAISNTTTTNLFAIPINTSTGDIAINSDPFPQ